VILVQCVNSKRDTAAPAKDLYDSTYFDVMRRYAEATQIDVLELCRGMEIGNRISRLQTLSREKENRTL